GARSLCYRVVVRQRILSWPVPGCSHPGVTSAILSGEFADKAAGRRTLEQTTACCQCRGPSFKRFDDAVAVASEAITAFPGRPASRTIQVVMDLLGQVFGQGIRNNDRSPLSYPATNASDQRGSGKNSR